MFRNLLGANDGGNPGEARVYPTTFRRPLWVRPVTLGTAISRLRVSDFKVRQISPTFERAKGLARSLYAPEFPLALRPGDLMERLRDEAPIDGVEIVEWMQISAVENIVMQARIAEYNRLGSEMLGGSNDPYIPGLVVSDIGFIKTLGSTVRSQGFAVATTPRGRFNVPSLGKLPGVFRDLISWGSISGVWSMQWLGSLLKWRSLAETPIRETVGFYSDYRGNAAPNFFVQIPTRPALSASVRQRFSSDGNQTLRVNFRDPTNYSRVVG
ncbi:MAG: hypothetical protein HWN68_21090, partial [Desulfobacterales bacterium]|nr:hypothetical protein [Desulfobacterales bacterium]